MNHRLYFNRCFTTTSKLIEQMKSNLNQDSFDIVISHSQPNHYLEKHAEHYEIEPKIFGYDYLNYIVSNCKKHNIEMFIPRHQVTTLAEYKDKFNKIGVKAMFVASPDIYQLIDDKVKTYEDLSPTGIVAIPETYIVSNLKEFQDAYGRITSNGGTACLKPISGIGGEGFKRIVEKSELEEAFTTSSTMLTCTRLERVLSSEGSVTPFMLSEFMQDDEWSIDCLAKNGELILAIPRCKKDSYRQNIEYREELIKIASDITKRYNLSYLFNIQVKYHKGIPHLIEINTRFSGGMYKVGATGANMLYWAIQLLKDEVPNIPMLRWNIQAFDTFDLQIRPLQ